MKVQLDNSATYAWVDVFLKCLSLGLQHAHVFGSSA